MRIKKLVTTTLATLLLVTMFSFSAVAAPLAPEDSDVDISFEAGTDPVNPVDPENPEEETGGPGTGQPGPLSLDFVPELGFGDAHQVSTTTKNYPTITARPYIQISDLRGTGSGWKVTASLSSFKNETSDTLNGAYITLSNGEAVSAATGVAAPTPSQNVRLTSDDEDTPVITAAAETLAGRGTWVNRWFTPGGDTHITLTVPAAAATIGQHTAVITWTLHDAP